MYFHLVWIKEKNWKKYDLDILLSWWDEDFIRKFLANRWIVIVSITEFKENPESFWNIIIDVLYENVQIKIILKWEDLEERLYFIMYSWIIPSRINFVDNPIPEDQMKSMIDSTLMKIKEEDEKVKKEKELAELEEQKKYEETWIKDWLKIINSNIDHIEQIIKAWEWIIMWNELKELDTYLNEMKKIRLWTNFNKMANLVLEAHKKVREAENLILDKYNDCEFPIDKNSIASNLDILKEYFYSNRLSQKGKLQPASLKPSESLRNVLWTNAIFLNLLRRDMSQVIDTSSIEEIFSITMNLVEYIVLIIIETVALIWLLSPLFWANNTSPYLLPALWRLWLLVYLFNSLNLKWVIVRIVWFIALAIVYWRGLVLLLNTFAL